jgi:hypothetical protein
MATICSGERLALPAALREMNFSSCGTQSPARSLALTIACNEAAASGLYEQSFDSQRRQAEAWRLTIHSMFNLLFAQDRSNAPSRDVVDLVRDPMLVTEFICAQSLMADRADLNLCWFGEITGYRLEPLFSAVWHLS